MLVVEDLISTAGSAKRVTEAIRTLGGKVTDLIAIYTHNLKESEVNLKSAKVNLYYLTDTKTTAQLAKQSGFLNQQQVDTI